MVRVNSGKRQIVLGYTNINEEYNTKNISDLHFPTSEVNSTLACIFGLDFTTIETLQESVSG